MLSFGILGLLIPLIFFVMIYLVYIGDIEVGVMRAELEKIADDLDTYYSQNNEYPKEIKQIDNDEMICPKEIPFKCYRIYYKPTADLQRARLILKANHDRSGMSYDTLYANRTDGGPTTSIGKNGEERYIPYTHFYKATCNDKPCLRYIEMEKSKNQDDWPTVE